MNMRFTIPRNSIRLLNYRESAIAGHSTLVVDLTIVGNGMLDKVPVPELEGVVIRCALQQQYSLALADYARDVRHCRMVDLRPEFTGRLRLQSHTGELSVWKFICELNPGFHDKVAAIACKAQIVEGARRWYRDAYQGKTLGILLPTLAWYDLQSQFGCRLAWRDGASNLTEA